LRKEKPELSGCFLQRSEGLFLRGKQREKSRNLGEKVPCPLDGSAVWKEKK